MVCLLQNGEGGTIAGWIIGSDLSEVRHKLMGRVAPFDPAVQEVAQEIYRLEGSYPSPQGRRELLGGRYSLLFD
jgi:hypothetical protein